jgi:hypothetical protein
MSAMPLLPIFVLCHPERSVLPKPRSSYEPAAPLYINVSLTARRSRMTRWLAMREERPLGRHYLFGVGLTPQ